MLSPWFVFCIGVAPEYLPEPSVHFGEYEGIPLVPDHLDSVHLLIRDFENIYSYVHLNRIFINCLEIGTVGSFREFEFGSYFVDEVSEVPEEDIYVWGGEELSQPLPILAVLLGLPYNYLQGVIFFIPYSSVVIVGKEVIWVDIVVFLGGDFRD